jgi:predicted TIM-barrel fold metal-dependent hydrolase
VIIDGHAHSCGIFYRAENIIKVIDELGVDMVVLCPGLVNDEKDQNLPNLAKWFPRLDLMLFMNRIIKLVHNLSKSKDSLIERNEYVFRLARQYPDRIIQFYWINPNESDALNDLIDKFSQWQFKGIKVHQPSDYFNLKHSSLHDIAYFAAQNKLPCFMHLHSKNDVRDFIQFVRQHPETNFIVAHLIGLELFEKHRIQLPNLCFDISPAPLISDQRILKAINLFGADRVMLSSDTPFGKDNLKRTIERIKCLPISQEHKDLILGNNFQSLLSL